MKGRRRQPTAPRAADVARLHDQVADATGDARHAWDAAILAADRALDEGDADGASRALDEQQAVLLDLRERLASALEDAGPAGPARDEPPVRRGALVWAIAAGVAAAVTVLATTSTSNLLPPDGAGPPVAERPAAEGDANVATAAEHARAAALTQPHPVTPGLLDRLAIFEVAEPATQPDDAQPSSAPRREAAPTEASTDGPDNGPARNPDDDPMPLRAPDLPPTTDTLDLPVAPEADLDLRLPAGEPGGDLEAPEDLEPGEDPEPGEDLEPGEGGAVDDPASATAPPVG